MEAVVALVAPETPAELAAKAECFEAYGLSPEEGNALWNAAFELAYSGGLPYVRHVFGVIADHVTGRA